MKKANTRRFLSPLSVLFVGESESGELSRPLSIGPPRSLAQLASREKALLSHCPEERLSPPIKLSFEKKGKHLESEHAPVFDERDMLGFVAGMLSIACWMVAQVRRKRSKFDGGKKVGGRTL